MAARARNHTLEISPTLRMPAQAVTRTFGILGQRGSGKTTTAGVFIEEIAPLAPFCVIDPTGGWYGLGSSADGKSAGLDVIVLGGHHGDVPLDESSGVLIAELIVRERYSVVLDLELLRKGAQVRFVADFLEALYHLNREPLHLVADEAQRYCLTEDTEVLTPSGWARWSDLRVGGDVVAFDPETGEYRDEPVLDIITREHNGEMVKLRGKGLDCLVTPDHRVVIRRSQRAKGRQKLYDWTFCPAGQVPHQVHLPTGGAPEGPGIPDLSLELLRVIGWVITDGYTHQASHTDALGLEQSLNTMKRGRAVAHDMDEVLTRIGATRCERGARVTTNREGERFATCGPSFCFYFKKPLTKLIRKWIGEVTDRIPRALIEGCSREQLEALYLGLLEGDGTAKGDRWVRFYPGQNEGLADDFQEVATRLGINTTKRWVKSIGQWHVHVNQRKHYYIRRPEREHYQGLVWDITVPSGAFVARRNGTIFVTGNCPQNPRGEGGHMPRAIGALEDIVKLGRRKGLGATVISQRPASLNKEVLEQVETLFVHRLQGPRDRKAVADWFEAQGDPPGEAEALASISRLKTGEAYVLSPSFLKVFERTLIRAKRTFDSSATPELGAKLRSPTGRAAVDLEALREHLSDAIERAEENNPVILRKRIAELERELAVAQRRKVAAGAAAEPRVIEKIVEVEKIVRVGGIKDAQVKRVEAALARVENERAALEQSGRELSLALEAARITTASPVAARPTRAARVPAVRPLSSSARPAPTARPAAAVAPREPVADYDSDLVVKAGARRMIEVLAAHHPMHLTRSQLATLSKVKKTGGTFSTYFGTLKRGGLLLESGEQISITEVGLDFLGGAAPTPATIAEIREMYRNILKAGARRMFDLLVEAYPSGNGLTREQLAIEAEVSQSGGTFSTYLGTLKRNGLAEEHNGVVSASPTLFLENN